MGQLLNFNPSRGLFFDPNDGVDFDTSRDRLFDADRELTFDSDRDLGFGKRGPVFRGFVCPVCGAAVTETQASCAECGASFSVAPAGDSRRSSKPVKRPPKVKTEKRSDRRPREAPAAPAPAAAAPATDSPSPSAGACSRCGARVLTTDAFCWNCGARFSRAESVPLGPAHQAQSVTKDWQETGKDLKDYLEK